MKLCLMWNKFLDKRSIVIEHADEQGMHSLARLKPVTEIRFAMNGCDVRSDVFRIVQRPDGSVDITINNARIERLHR